MTVSQIAPPAPPSVWHMYRALVGVGLCCGLLIVSVFEVTRPIIRVNRIEARQAAIFQVLPGAVGSQVFRIADDGSLATAPADSDGQDLVFAAYDDEGRLVGVALQAQGMGYQDVVSVLYGYSFDKQAVVGIVVLESKETPGLGDRVETDENYLANFEQLDVSLDEAGAELANPIEFVKQGKKQSPWQIDGITGATITSKAIADMLRESTAWWIPRVAPHEQAFAGKD